MNVFADLHHSGLYYSLHILFEKRLGGNLYRPIGTNWFEDGFWDIAKPYNNNPATIVQYLQITPYFAPIDGSPALNTVSQLKSTHYEVRELEHDYIQKAITLDQFKEMDIDIIIASIPDHWVTYKKLRDIYKPKAMLICHMGNIGWDNEKLIKQGQVENLLASVKPFDLPKNINLCWYHQELPIVDFKLPLRKQITSFVHLFPKPEQYYRYTKALPDFDWKAYGAGAPDGWKNGLVNIYQGMQESMWGYHVKPGGDGMGHIWHSWCMVGRPLLTNFSDYKDKLGGLLFEHTVTGIDLEQGTVSENAAFVRHYSDPEAHARMCMAVRKRFEEIVNYDIEEKKIRKFIEKSQ